jgi:hypothetical protein
MRLDPLEQRINAFACTMAPSPTLHCLTAPVAGIAGAIIAIEQGEDAADEAVATAAAPSRPKLLIGSAVA